MLQSQTTMLPASSIQQWVAMDITMSAAERYLRNFKISRTQLQGESPQFKHLAMPLAGVGRWGEGMEVGVNGATTLL